ncbi:MAG: hypothetical protein COB67_03560 [SAR324 cluster bacterium]|uniref:Cell division protein ZapB n=1 Tax=SAR324 cluster bacterium TaxID=2024889 RepID=A0A2A4T8K5_9DELT|nr:MAG: hypothetical protein COB67_03560 [SAR324 cluster bacterium]
MDIIQQIESKVKSAVQKIEQLEMRVLELEDEKKQLEDEKKQTEDKLQSIFQDLAPVDEVVEEEKQEETLVEDAEVSTSPFA